MNDDSFFVAGGRLRPVWRFLISTLLVILVYLFIGIFLGVLANTLGLSFNLMSTLFVVNLLVLATLLGLYKMFCLYVDEKPLASVGLAFRGRWKYELAMGFVLGAVMILAVAGLERTFGAAYFSWTPLTHGEGQKVAIWALYSIVILSVAGTTEELSFRGYPFQRLADAIGPWGATAVFSALFGLVHLGNASHTWISTCNTMLVGVTFAVAYFRTRALWLPVGLHVSWNLVQGYVLGLPVSGIQLPATLLRPQLHGAEILTGGSYGPEGGVLATAVFIAATFYLLFSKSIYVSKEMRELVLGADPVEGSGPGPAPAEGSSRAGSQFPQA